MKEIKDTLYYSKIIGELPTGCQMCVKGEKMVLYITGVCPRKCWYCPLSERRKDKDVVFINEWETNSIEDMIEEVKLCSSKGCGITGGDPLSRLSRTVEYIKVLKENFGTSFHIHLYTSFDLVTQESLEKLYSAGLDEIRFHVDFEKKDLWGRIDIANEFDWDVGLEIPAIPKEKETILKICDFYNNKIKFFNMNEFEISDTNSQEMIGHGFEMKSDISHGIYGSEKIATEIMEYVVENGLSFNVHYCSSKLKDKVQMQNRFKLRAENVKTKFDIVTEEGMLIRGCIYLKDMKHDLKELERVAQELCDEGLDVFVDSSKKMRILTYPEHVEQFADVLKEKFGLVCAIIEEDPTVEAFEVNRDFL